MHQETVPVRQGRRGESDYLTGVLRCSDIFRPSHNSLRRTNKDFGGNWICTVRIPWLLMLWVCQRADGRERKPRCRDKRTGTLMYDKHIRVSASSFMKEMGREFSVVSIATVFVYPSPTLIFFSRSARHIPPVRHNILDSFLFLSFFWLWVVAL